MTVQPTPSPVDELRQILEKMAVDIADYVDRGRKNGRPVDFLGDYIGAAEAAIQAKITEAEHRAARKIQAVINAHKGLNPGSEVLSLVEASLSVIDKLEAEAEITEAYEKGRKDEQNLLPN